MLLDRDAVHFTGYTNVSCSSLCASFPLARCIAMCCNEPRACYDLRLGVDTVNAQGPNTEVSRHLSINLAIAQADNLSTQGVDCGARIQRPPCTTASRPVQGAKLVAASCTGTDPVASLPAIHWPALSVGLAVGARLACGLKPATGANSCIGTPRQMVLPFTSCSSLFLLTAHLRFPWIEGSNTAIFH